MAFKKATKIVFEMNEEESEALSQTYFMLTDINHDVEGGEDFLKYIDELFDMEGSLNFVLQVLGKISELDGEVIEGRK